MSYLGEEIKKLGFGLMRLPEYEQDGEKQVDLNQLNEMVDLFMDAGFTYFDTAYGYHGGRSEEAVKEALVKRHPRESFQLATKLPAWAVDTADKAKAMFTTSLERTGAGYFDFFLLHNLGQHRTDAFEKFGIWDYMLEQKEKGLIKHLGFSFHDNAEELRRVLEVHPEVEFVQLQINYADWESDEIESRKCFEVAQEFGKPVIVMEPVRGGALADPPKQVAAVFEEASKEASLASWAIRYAASLPNVITVLSGMSTVDQMKDNISFMREFTPLSDAEYQVVKQAQEELAAIPSIPCTDCRYCLEGCPTGVKIPAALSALNVYLIYRNLDDAKIKYAWNTEDGRASECIACGACEEVCPQHIHIIDELKRSVELLEE